jgi:hypothetical protein
MSRVAAAGAKRAPYQREGPPLFGKQVPRGEQADQAPEKKRVHPGVEAPVESRPGSGPECVPHDHTLDRCHDDPEEDQAENRGAADLQDEEQREERRPQEIELLLDGLRS